MPYQWIVLFHVLGATIWTGGHLVLALSVLPASLRQKDPAILEAFESRFERVGIPALLIQVVTGLWLAHTRLGGWGGFFQWDDWNSRQVTYKLILLGLTILFALDARLRIIPNLSEKNLRSLAWHIIPVTVISVLFVFVGVGFRVGGFFN